MKRQKKASTNFTEAAAGGASTASTTQQSPDVAQGSYCEAEVVPAPPTTEGGDSSIAEKRLLIDLYDPDLAHVAINVPVESLVSIPPHDKRSTAQYPPYVLCRQFIAERMCARGACCLFVHGDASLVPAERKVHVNFLLSDLSKCRYPRLPAGRIYSVFAPNGRLPYTDVSSDRILCTNGSRRTDEEILERPMSHCAHYHFNRVCNRGDRCMFVHVVNVDPSVTSDNVLVPPPARKEPRQPKPAADGTQREPKKKVAPLPVASISNSGTASQEAVKAADVPVIQISSASPAHSPRENDDARACSPLALKKFLRMRQADPSSLSEALPPGNSESSTTPPVPSLTSSALTQQAAARRRTSSMTSCDGPDGDGNQQLSRHSSLLSSGGLMTLHRSTSPSEAGAQVSNSTSLSGSFAQVPDRQTLTSPSGDDATPPMFPSEPSSYPAPEQRPHSGQRSPYRGVHVGSKTLLVPVRDISAHSNPSSASDLDSSDVRCSTTPTRYRHNPYGSRSPREQTPNE